MHDSNQRRSPIALAARPEAGSGETLTSRRPSEPRPTCSWRWERICSEEGLRETPRRMAAAYGELLTPRPFRPRRSERRGLRRARRRP